MKSTVEAQFAGNMFLLDAAGVLYWPRERLLVVSDMHLEKSTFLAQHGSSIAPYDTMDTLNRLEQLIHRYQPHELLLLGDSFHDRRAWARLGPELQQRLLRLCGEVEVCSWIEGNHDAALLNQGCIRFHEHRVVGGIVFSHEYIEHTLPQIIGHYHPKVRVGMAGRYVRGRCFAHTERLFVMPAFGSFTGGLDVEHAAFRIVTGGEPLRLYVMHGSSVFPVTQAAAQRRRRGY